MPRIVSLASIVGLQAIGSVSAFASTFLVARERGAEIQGGFGLAKAEVDLMVALLLIGLPQAIFYFLHQGALTWSHVRRLTAGHAVVATAAVLLFEAIRGGAIAAEHGLPGALAIAVAVGALVVHGNLRAAMLEARSAAVFSIVTAFPGLFLLLAVITTLAAGGMNGRSTADVGPVLAAAYLIACLCTLGVMWRIRDGGAATVRPPSLAQLGKYGVSTWIPAIAQNLSPVIALTWIDRHIEDPVGTGIFSAAILSLNLVLTPFAMLVPLLFKRWVAVEAEARRTELRRLLVPAAGICAAVAVLFWIVQEPVVRVAFGAEYLTRGGVFAVLALGLWPQAASRLFGVMFSAGGRPWLAVVGEVGRVVTLASGLFLFEIGQLVTLACLWVGAEFVSPAIGWMLSRRYDSRTGVPQR